MISNVLATKGHGVTLLFCQRIVRSYIARYQRCVDDKTGDGENCTGLVFKIRRKHYTGQVSVRFVIHLEQYITELRCNY